MRTVQAAFMRCYVELLYDCGTATRSSRTHNCMQVVGAVIPDKSLYSMSLHLIIGILCECEVDRCV